MERIKLFNFKPNKYRTQPLIMDMAKKVLNIGPDNNATIRHVSQ